MATAFKRRSAAQTAPIVNQPMLLVFNEKHGDRYFNVPNDEALFAAALKIVTERFEQGYWYVEPEENEKPAAPDFTKEQIATLPESMREAAQKKLREYERSLHDYNELVDGYARIKKAVDEKDGRVAWEVIRDRCDAEYEGYALKPFESVEDEGG